MGYKELFEVVNKKSLLPEYQRYCELLLDKKNKSSRSARVPGMYGKSEYLKLFKKYQKIPEKGIEPKEVISKTIEDFFTGIPRWKSPKLVHNVGAPVNVLSSTIYSLALDENIYNINEGLAGNAMAAEQIVVNLLSRLAKINKQTVGLFTFGGTGTNFYATKMGIKKADPESGNKGIKKNIKAVITEDSHYSHLVCTDWLGLGMDNVIILKARVDRRSDIKDAEEKIKNALNSGGLISSIILNGGTTYDHAIDDIPAFVKMRDRLVKNYKLNYKPHIHVDSVIGWSWLFFLDYQWRKNPLKIKRNVLNVLKKQTKRISSIKYADSWGIDLHKGIGGCPLPCSLIIFNNPDDLNLISKKKGSVIQMAQIAEEFCCLSPADFTLETSRPGGAPLAALVSLYSMGKEGFQRSLANLMSDTLYLREKISTIRDFYVLNQRSLGFATMVRIYPKGISQKEDIEKNSIINKYIKKFFEWDQKVRMMKNKGIEYSVSSAYIKLQNGEEVCAIKIYPVSPHFSKKEVIELIRTLVKQKEIFDREIWKND